MGTAAYGLIPFIPLEFFPDTDREEIFIETSLEPGTLIDETEEMADEIEAWLYEQEEVRSVSTYIGTEIPRIFGADGGGGSAEQNDGNFLVFIHGDGPPSREVMNAWNEEFIEEFPELERANLSIIESGPPVGAPIAIEISGEDMDVLFDMAESVEELLEAEDGVGGVEVDAGRNLSGVSFSPDREALEEYGIASDEISQQLRLLGDGMPLGQLQQGNRLLDMRMVYDTEGSVETEDLERVFVSGGMTQGAGMPGAQGDGAPEEEGGPGGPGEEEIPEEAGVEEADMGTTLDQLVTWEEGTSIEAIPHQDMVRTVTVRAYPGERDVDEVVADLEGEIAAVEASVDGYDINVGGETEARTDVFIDIGQIFVIVVFLILIIIAVQFYSLVMPFLVLSAVYLAISGTLIGLFLTQTGLGFMSMMGAVSLAGIVVRNGIVMIEFFEQRRNEGKDLIEAVVEVGEERFRPIVLTSLTSIGGLLPIALGDNPLFQPLGVAIVSGLSSRQC
ncbi:efflux RND transporter permease subunit [Thalassobacillus sp. C254]|uniref:efflux RND transporter permease subunit n=1 Tax=Thalassobacillus sp. C254 TaxID=1225341 RepID=UPI0022B74855|nr:efflux RND transporter permease subunit [Thalassobacillus sp. C254]